MIDAEHLAKQFDDFVAVHDVSLHVPQGELLALLGPNGAGKTTTVRILSAILRPTRGRASLAGYDTVQQADQVRRSVGLLTEQPGLYDRMTGIEYLQFYGRLYGLSDAQSKRRSQQMFERFAMPGAEVRRLGEYSKGMRQKVGLIRALLHDPPVLLLDEPTSAMDPHSARLVRDAIYELRHDHRTVILCTHNLYEAESLADRIAIIRQGRILTQGTPAWLKQELLGLPQMEVKLDRSLNGQVKELNDLVTVEYFAGDTIRYRAERPQIVNPLLVRRLHELGLGVVGLYEVPQSLEEVYLRVVSGEK
ncbi:MAG: ABC transporter ATP-binding protein [Candidatus Promineifilaceae bacterium]